MGELTLVFGTRAGDSAWDDFSPFGDEVFKRLRLFVVDHHIGIGAKTTDFASMVNSAASFPFGFYCGHLYSFPVSSAGLLSSDLVAWASTALPVSGFGSAAELSAADA